MRRRIDPVANHPLAEIAYLCTCGNRLQAPARWAGLDARCPSCGETSTVPGSSEMPCSRRAQSKPTAAQPTADTPFPVLEDAVDKPGRSRRRTFLLVGIGAAGAVSVCGVGRWLWRRWTWEEGLAFSMRRSFPAGSAAAWTPMFWKTFLKHSLILSAAASPSG